MRASFRLESAPPIADTLQAPNSKGLLRAFWVVAGMIAVLLAYAFVVEPSWRVPAAALIAASALFPAYLWCAEKVPGVPLFPVFALTYLWTFGYPLASRHPIVAIYTEQAAFMAAVIVSAFLLISTLIWQQMVKRIPPYVGEIRAMAPGQGDYLFCGFILTAALINIIVFGGWFNIFQPGFSIIRAAVFGLASVGIFVLAYRWGRREMERHKVLVFGVSFVLFIISQTMALFLIGAMVGTLLGTAAFVFGRREIPWKWLAVMGALFVVLHAGKGEMRERYWNPQPVPIQLWEYPGFLSEWLDLGVQEITSPYDDDVQPLYERLSLVHLLLKVLEESPHKIPYLEGETYAVIPHLLVPRVLNAEKLTAHEGTRILNVHYNLQRREDTERTTIAWGLLNEAIANFGMAGILLLAVVVGTLYGWVTRFSAGMPVLSLRTLVAVTFIAFAVQAEYTAGVYFSALLQSLVALFGMSYAFMDRRYVSANEA